jgi:ABC-2 type transport system ATP-binding protein
MASGTHVRIDGVRKSYGGVAALADLDLELGSGITGLLGPNGAGKTTLIRILATVLAPSAGEVRVNGWTASNLGDRVEIRRRLGYLPQDLGLYPRFTVFEFVDYLAILKELDDPADRHRRVRSALEAVELEDLAGRRSAPCRAACAGGSGSPRRSWPTRSCCCWTSPPPAWTPSSGCASAS